MVTANHILGRFFAFVAMGISVFCSFVFCGKREVLLPPLARSPKCPEDRGGLWSATLCLEQNVHARDGAVRSFLLKSHLVMHTPLW